MTKRHTSLFLGNGINLLDDSAASWKDVLQDLADFAGKPKIMDGAEYKPFTLIYEEVIAAIGEPDPESAEKEVKERVAKAIEEIPRNAYHDHFESLGFRHILTTNYDYNIGTKGKTSNLRPESKYSVFRRRINGNQSIWMLHGEIGKPETIMLGHEQYSGSLQKMRTYVTSKEKAPGGYSSPFRYGNYDFDDNSKVHSWVDVFLRDDIHILGFTLDYTEIDLWWIIAYKARLKRRSSLQPGTTNYYLFTHNRRDPKIEAKVALLESLGVCVFIREVKNHEYKKHYDWAINKLKK